MAEDPFSVVIGKTEALAWARLSSLEQNVLAILGGQSYMDLLEALDYGLLDMFFLPVSLYFHGYGKGQRKFLKEKGLGN